MSRTWFVDMENILWTDVLNGLRIINLIFNMIFFNGSEYLWHSKNVSLSDISDNNQSLKEAMFFYILSSHYFGNYYYYYYNYYGLWFSNLAINLIWLLNWFLDDGYDRDHFIHLGKHLASLDTTVSKDLLFSLQSWRRALVASKLGWRRR
jgi:hypothetical protein